MKNALCFLIFILQNLYIFIYTFRQIQKYKVKSEPNFPTTFRCDFGVIANSCDFGEIGGWHVGWFDQHSQHSPSSWRVNVMKSQLAAKCYELIFAQGLCKHIC